MALNICVEAVIRLFFEIINFVFGDVTLLFRGHPEALWTVVLPETLRTIVWVVVFYLVKHFVRIRIVANAIIITIPLLLQLAAGALAAIPFIGWLFAGAVAVTAGVIAAIAWGFLTITDETVPAYLRIVGLPGMMVLGFISGIIGPLGIVMGMGAVAGLAFIANIVIPLSTLAVVVLTWWSPTWFCEMLNTSLKVLANIRQEGLVEGIEQSLYAIPFLIKNKIVKPDKER